MTRWLSLTVAICAVVASGGCSTPDESVTAVDWTEPVVRGTAPLTGDADALSIPTTVLSQVATPTTLIPRDLELAGARASLDLRACRIELVMTNDTIGFAFNSAQLGDDRRALIRKLAPSLTGASNIRVRGHSSGEGDRNYNITLSERRAAAVWATLSFDLPGVTALIDGVGPDQPVASDATESGRSQNRRVVIRADLPRRRCK